jgi:hypothetical protein
MSLLEKRCFDVLKKRSYSAAENYRNITLRAVMIFYSPIGSRDSKIS